MDEWFEAVEPRPNARVRLIVFPHAGSQPMAYFKWSRALAPHVEVYVASYPERGVRRGAPAPTSFREKITRMVNALEQDGIDVPCVVGCRCGRVVSPSLLLPLLPLLLLLVLRW